MTNMAITPPPPRPKRLFEVLVRLHDDVGQLKYPYSAKILKWGIIQESELEEASKDNPNASEKTVWEDVRPADVAVRIAGGLTQFVDQEGFRAKWVEHGSLRVRGRSSCPSTAGSRRTPRRSTATAGTAIRKWTTC